jgi:hypothetical protein
MKLIYKITTLVISASLCHATSAGWFDTVKRLDCSLEVTKGIVSRVQLELNLTTKKVNIFGPGYGVAPGGGIFRYEVLSIQETKDTLTFGDPKKKITSTYEIDRKSLDLKYITKFFNEETTYGQCQVVDKFEFKMIPMDKNQL